MNATVKVELGNIIVNDVSVARESDHALLLLADLKAKYADVMQDQTGGEVRVVLTRGPQTLDAEAGNEATQIILRRTDLKPDDWFVEASVSRYTLVVVAVKREPR